MLRTLLARIPIRSSHTRLQRSFRFQGKELAPNPGCPGTSRPLATVMDDIAEHFEKQVSLQGRGGEGPRKWPRRPRRWKRWKRRSEQGQGSVTCAVQAATAPGRERRHQVRQRRLCSAGPSGKLDAGRAQECAEGHRDPSPPSPLPSSPKSHDTFKSSLPRASPPSYPVSCIIQVSTIIFLRAL